MENVTEPKEKILVLVRIVPGLQIWQPVALTTRLIASINVNVS